MLRRAVALFLPAAAAMTLAFGITYLAVQQDLRIGANDIPQQLAEDGTRALDAGTDPATVVGVGQVPIEASLTPFVAIYDGQGRLLAANGSLDGKPPAPPVGVLRSAQSTGRDAVTWQPREGVRVALVVLPWHGGTIAAGRSLREIETRIDAIGELIALGWLAGLVIVGVIAGLAAWVWPAIRDASTGLTPGSACGRRGEVIQWVSDAGGAAEEERPMPRLFRRVAALMTVGGLAGAMLFATPAAAAGQNQTYLIVYKNLSVPAKLAKSVSDAGGTLVASYDAIGVAVVRSANPTFAPKLRGDTSVASVAATAGSAVRLSGDPASEHGRDFVDQCAGLGLGLAVRPPVGHGPDPRAGGPRDHAAGVRPSWSVTSTPASTTPIPTSPPTSTDADSANCVSGAPVPGMVAAMDDNGHGTHTAGTIAAASNGIGIVGVAPNVKIAGIKAGNADGFFFPEAVVCAFMWAGESPHRRDQQQLLRRSVAVQLQERPGAAGHPDGRAARDPLRQSRR